MERNKAIERRALLGCFVVIAVAVLGISLGPQVGKVIENIGVDNVLAIAGGVALLYLGLKIRRSK